MAYFSTLLTATKTRYAAFRSDLDADGDTEDDSHISRVLRTYYSDSGAPYPDWLGPPPNSRSQSPASSAGGSLRSSYGRNSAHAPPQQQHSTSLSDIWDSPAGAGSQQQAGPGKRMGFGGLMGRNQQGGGSGTQSAPPAQGQQMGPPSLRTSGRGYSQQQQDQGVTSPLGGAVTSAQQRIKERLWGGRSSPVTSQNSAYAPPPQREEKPYMGAGMPWDDGDGGMGYAAPAGGYYTPGGGKREERGGGGGGYGQRGYR